jgi:hypothetical protein
MDDDLRCVSYFPWTKPRQEYCSGSKVSDCLCQKGRKVSRIGQMVEPKAAGQSSAQRQKGGSSCRVRRFQGLREACMSCPRDGALLNLALLFGRVHELVATQVHSVYLVGITNSRVYSHIHVMPQKIHHKRV